MTAHGNAVHSGTSTHDPGRLRPVAAQVVAEWAPGTFLEGLAGRPDGSWLVSVPSHNRVDLVRPDGRRDVFADLPDRGIGIVADGDGAFVIVGSLRERNWRLVRVDHGASRTVCPLPQLTFGNGLAAAGGRLLATDSEQGLVLAVDPVGGTSSIWLRHELLTGFTADVPLPGANGIAVRDGAVYVTNTGQALLLRCPLHSADPAAELETVATRLVADGVDLGADGLVYLATHFLDSVVRLDLNGSRTTIAGPEQGIVGSTTVAVDPYDPTALLVATTGGMKGVTGPGDGPARLVRLRLDQPLDPPSVTDEAHS